MDDVVPPPPLSHSPRDQGAEGQAPEIVAALDRIIDSLMAVTPAEGIGGEIPLTFSEVRAVRALPMSGAVSMHVLAQSLGVALPTATHMVDRLIEKGMAVRTRPEYDRRVVLVELSDRAKAHRGAQVNRRVLLVERLIDPLLPTVRVQVARILNEIAQAASSHAAALRDTR